MNTLTRGNYFSGISLVPGRILRVMSHLSIFSHIRDVTPTYAWTSEFAISETIN